MSHTLLLILTASGLAFAAGFFARRGSGPERTPIAAMSPVSRTEAGPEAAAQFVRSWSAALTNADPVQRTEGLLDLLASADAAASRRLAVRHADDPEVLALILRRWVSLDPRGAARWVEESERDGLTTSGAMTVVVETWALRDPSGLIAWFKEPAHVWLQYGLMEKLTGAVFARDPQAALALASEFPETWRLPAGAMTWVRENAAAAAQTLGGLPLTPYSAPLLRQAAGTWAEQDPAAAAAWGARLMEKRGLMGSSAISTVLEKWVERDPAAATAFLRSLPRGYNAGLNMVCHWAKQDAGAALAWIASQAHPSERARMMTESVRAAARNDVSAAAAFVAQMPDNGMRDKAQVAMAEAWAENDPATALAWSDELPSGPARNASLARTAAAWARKDTAAAAAWAKAAPEGSLPGQVYASVMDSLRPDRAAAYAWLNELPESAAFSAISRFGGSTGADVAAVLSLPDGKYKAPVLERTVTGYFVRDPDNAIAWAAALPTGPERESVRRALEAAPVVTVPMNWSSLTEAKKQELLRRLP